MSLMPSEVTVPSAVGEEDDPLQSLSCLGIQGHVNQPLSFPGIQGLDHLPPDKKLITKVVLNNSQLTNTENVQRLYQLANEVMERTNCYKKAQRILARVMAGHKMSLPVRSKFFKEVLRAEPTVDCLRRAADLMLLVAAWEVAPSISKLTTLGPIYKRGPLCVHCHDRKTEIRCCSSCKVARYCSTPCQSLDWPKHREACSDISLTLPSVVTRESGDTKLCTDSSDDMKDKVVRKNISEKIGLEFFCELEEN